MKENPWSVAMDNDGGDGKVVGLDPVAYVLPLLANCRITHFIMLNCFFIVL